MNLPFRVPSLVLALALLLLMAGLIAALSALTGVGTDDTGRPCITHWQPVPGCHGYRSPSSDPTQEG